MKKTLIIITAVVGLLAFTGCGSTGASQNYSADTYTYVAETPFETASGGEIVEKTDLTITHNQTRDIAELTILVDGTYDYKPDSITFGDSNGTRSGGFYLSAKGISTKINEAAVTVQSVEDTNQLKSNNEMVGDVVESGTEGLIEGVLPAILE